MRPFQYTRAPSLAEASNMTAGEDTLAIAGGTNLLDLMKLQVEKPAQLADINRLGFADIEDTDDGGLRLGAGFASGPWSMRSMSSDSPRGDPTPVQQRGGCGGRYEQAAANRKRAAGSPAALGAVANRTASELGAGLDLDRYHVAVHVIWA